RATLLARYFTRTILFANRCPSKPAKHAPTTNPASVWNWMRKKWSGIVCGELLIRVFGHTARFRNAAVPQVIFGVNVLFEKVIQTLLQSFPLGGVIRVRNQIPLLVRIV